MSRRADTVGRWATHILLQPRRRSSKALARFASSVPAGSRVLEFGSGRQVGGKFPFSRGDHFEHCEFITSDIDPSFGHMMVDIADPPFDQEFDFAIAPSVLEHVQDHKAAISGILRVLVAGGKAWISVPFLYPLHDEPNDYWRFSEHALRLLLDSFSELTIDYAGPRKAPLAYYVTATK